MTYVIIISALTIISPASTNELLLFSQQKYSFRMVLSQMIWSLTKSKLF
jgi:hypothetical protein